MKLPRVLIGVCTYEGKDYIWPKFKENLAQLSYPNYDVMIVDNGKDNKYARRIKKECDFIVKHIPRAINSRIGHAESLNTIRDYFLANNYDYLLLVESDLLPPVDIIERLLVTGKDVIGCMYYIGHHWDEKRQPTACLFKVDPKTGKTRRVTREEGWKMYGTGVQPIHGCGIGTTLVARSIIEQYKFWWHLSNPPKHSDVLFFADLHNDGIQAYVNTDVIIPHYASDWDKVKDI